MKPVCVRTPCGGVGKGVNFAPRYYALCGREVARGRDVTVLLYCAGIVPGPTCLMLYVRTYVRAVCLWAWKMRLRFYHYREILV